MRRAPCQLHPELPLVIAGRDTAKAEALAAELGHGSPACTCRRRWSTPAT
ncbi:hypothetical protein QO058_04120 [Bosea vestrisii]|nr:hypothetical protein [Bosea vestrisii]WID97462.1 hypothetical protein QO058_04120 [Bosea vestrisii]